MGEDMDLVARIPLQSLGKTEREDVDPAAVISEYTNSRHLTLSLPSGYEFRNLRARRPFFTFARVPIESKWIEVIEDTAYHLNALIAPRY